MTAESFSRQAALGLLARATPDELAAAKASCAPTVEGRDLRQPEIGLVMVRGRMGGDGGAFNLGEATVSRAVVALADGTVGHGHTLGRAPEKARLIAMFDALLQTDRREAIEKALLAPLSQRLAAERDRARRETAATKVDFFTLVRGED